MFLHDGLETIEITRKQLFEMLKKRVEKRSAKTMAYDTQWNARFKKWKAEKLRDSHGWSTNLKDIRLIYLFRGRLTDEQRRLLRLNKQKYAIRGN